MSSFLSSALGVNNLSHLVDRVSQLKDNIERTLDNAVGEPADIPDTTPDVEDVVPSFSSTTSLASLGKRRSSNSSIVNGTLETTQGIDATKVVDEVQQNTNEQVDSGIVDEEKQATVDTPPTVVDEPVVDGAQTEVIAASADGDDAATDKETELLATLRRREAQLEKSSRQLAEQEEQLNQLRDALQSASADKRVRAAESKAAQLMKEGLALSEKQGKTDALLRKVRKEKEEIETKGKQLAEQLKKEQEQRVALEAELNELRDVRKRGDASIAQIAETNADHARRLEEARTQAAQASQREQEMKSAMERTFAEVADQKKLITQLTQQLNAAKREAEHAKFQLKEQLDSKQLHGSRADSMERSLAEAKAALEEHMRESRQLESDLRSQVNRVNEQLHLAEKRAEEAAAKALELTVPLLRQIDQLNEQRAKSEQHSSTLLTRAVAAETAEAEATAAKRKVEQARSELQVKVTELESLLTSTKTDAARALSDCKLALKRAEEAEKERDAIQRAMDALRSSTDTKIAEQRLTEMQLRQNLAGEMDKYERAKRIWEEKSREAEERHQIEVRKYKQAEVMAAPATPFFCASMPTQNGVMGGNGAHDGFVSPPPSHSRRLPSEGASSVISASGMMAASQEEILGSVLYGDDFSTPNSVGMDMLSVNEAGVTSSRYLLQASELQSGVRRRDQQIKMLSVQLELALKQKEDLVKEVANLQQRVRSLESIQEKETGMAREIVALQKQNTLLLELLGEKEEQIEGLTSDLDDVKTKFREQIQVLLQDQ